MVAGLVASLVLLVSGDDVAAFWDVMFSWPGNRNIVSILNTTALLYLSGVAAAIGFRMNLFNIGVEGQYQHRRFRRRRVRGPGLAPGQASTPWLPSWSRWPWEPCGRASPASCGSARGVSEVISTIMLNAIAGSLVTYFLLKVGVSNGNATNTKPIPEGSRVGTHPACSATVPRSSTDCRCSPSSWVSPSGCC